MQNVKAILMVLVFFSIQSLQALESTSPELTTESTDTVISTSTTTTPTTPTPTPITPTPITPTPTTPTPTTPTPPDSTTGIETDDKSNSEILNTLPAVNILNLSGRDASGREIKRFIIHTLPSRDAGILYLEDGTTEVTAGQYLTLEEANNIRFDPNETFEGVATFTYCSVDINDNIDPTPATVTIPVVAPSGSVSGIETDDKSNSEILNTLPAVNILNLSGRDANGGEIKRFIIHTLPSRDAGILYMEDEETEVTAGQYLTLEEANNIRFDPNENFEGVASFTYCSVDSNDNIDPTPATVTIPVVAHSGGHTPNCTCEDYESSIPAFSKFGILLIMMLTVFMGTFFIKKEI